MERNVHLPTIETVERIAAALGVAPCWLAYGTEGSKQFQQKRPRMLVASTTAAANASPGSFCAHYKGVSDRLRALREDRQLSLRQLAEAAGISFQTVANTEAGTTVPKVDNVERLAVALDCAPCWLAFGVGAAGPKH